MTTIQTVSHPRTAATLLAHPLRTRILAHARDPVSASELARRLGQPRQRINYHVRQLADAGFLEAAGRQQKRNMVEQQYVASADAYVLTPDVLGDAAPPMETAHNDASAGHLVALCARAQSEVAELMESARDAGVRVRTTSTISEVRFANAEQRAAFTAELLAAIDEVVARYTSENGRPFRVMVGCYPAPAE